jgi:hypothetical protein
VRVESARIWHHIRGAAAEHFRLPPSGGALVHRGAVAGKADEAHRLGLQPRNQALDARGTGAVLVGGKGVGARRRPLDEVGHAHAVDPEGVQRIVGTRDEPGRKRRGPEPVPRSCEPDSGVGRVLARIETDQQHAHARADGVGEHPRARCLDVDPLFAVVDELVDREARAFDDVA